MSLDSLTFINMRRPAAFLSTGGQLSLPELKRAAELGVQHIINLRPASEDAGFDEDAVVAELGMGYCRIPIAGPADLNLANVEALDRQLAKAAGKPSIVHCASGNRVGALMALRAKWLHGADIEDALAIGRAHGLTAMEAQVRALLSGA